MARADDARPDSLTVGVGTVFRIYKRAERRADGLRDARDVTGAYLARPWRRRTSVRRRRWRGG